VSAPVDDIDLFEALAAEMNARPERFAGLGECDMVATLVMQRDDGSAFAAEIVFEELGCAGVHTVGPDEVDRGDFKLVGPLAAWEAMFADVRTNGYAVGRQTINSLALLGTDIALRGADPMGVDKFSRFNQTLQEYLDGAARVAAEGATA
jgi:hypothetical protein